MEKEIVINRKVHISEGCCSFIQGSKWDLSIPTTVIYAHDFVWGGENLKLDYLEDDFKRMNVRDCVMLTPKEIEKKLKKMPKHQKRTLKT